MTEDALTAQLRSELEQIAAVVSDLTGLSSNWNGQLVLVPEAGFQGKKLYSCGILISRELAASDLRWRTLIHEALHAVSVGYVRSDYDAAMGWEEGGVEQIQRLPRPQVLARLGVTADMEVMTEYETMHRFNERIAALERLRLALNRRDEVLFYLELLATPIKDRPGLMLAHSRFMSAQERASFVRVFSAENALLKKPDVKGIKNVHSTT